QVKDVIGDRLPQPDFLLVALDFERAVILRDAFVQPWRQRARIVAGQRVDVFVKDHRVGADLAKFRSQQNIVDVFAGLKITRDGGGLALIQRFVGGESAVVLKDDNGDRNRRTGLRSGEDARKYVPELLQPHADLANILLARIADEQEVF